MNKSRVDVTAHTDAALFREALNFTASRTEFSAALVEKDYFCSLALSYLMQSDSSGLVFKGGTCLAKVYSGFYRLSEDLDFSIPLDADATRAKRRLMAVAVKDLLNDMETAVPVFRLVDQLTGAHESSQYVGTIAYASHIRAKAEPIKIEVGLREPLILPPETRPARTLLLDPISGAPSVEPIPVVCLALEEQIAEKCRAALTRREPAIRDFYDLLQIARIDDVDLFKEEQLEAVRKKLAISGNDPINVSEDRIRAVRAQRVTTLKPVLRDADFEAFDVESAIQIVSKLAGRLQSGVQ